MNILHTECNPEMAKDRKLPYNSYLVCYMGEDQVLKHDIAMSGTAVELFDTQRSFRDYTFNPELDINKLDAFIKTENGYIKQEAGPMNTKKGLNIEVSNLQYQYLYDLVMFAYEMNLPNEKGWDLQTYDNLVDNVCNATETNLSNTVRGV